MKVRKGEDVDTMVGRGTSVKMRLLIIQESNPLKRPSMTAIQGDRGYEGQEGRGRQYAGGS